MNKTEILAYFFILACLFLFSIYSGYLVAMNDPMIAKNVLTQFSQEFGFIKQLPRFLIFFIIFINNTVKAFVAMLLGVLFGLVPVLFVMINGIMVGIVVYVVGERIGTERVIMLLLPHGMIEIPAMLLACSYGVWLGRMFFERLRGKDVSMKEMIKEAVSKFVRTVLPMLLIAAFIEAYITPMLAKV